jgi:hypothetical protein
VNTIRWSDPRLLSALLVGAAALSIVHLEWSFGFAAAGFFGLVFIAVILAAVGSFLWGYFARRRIGLVIGAYLLLLVAFQVLVVHEIGISRKAESLRRGDMIAAALSSFRAEHDRYPDSLPELVPKYLPEIPNTAMAALHEVHFHYRLSDQGGFELSFPAPKWLTCYRNESIPWACND